MSKEIKCTVYNIKELWRKACKHDGIPEDSSFVVFSEDNPYLTDYNKAATIVTKIMKGGK